MKHRHDRRGDLYRRELVDPRLSVLEPRRRAGRCQCRRLTYQPAFTTLFAIVVLGEPFRLYNGLGFAVILVGWLLTTGSRKA
jgi:hypothetical protein